MKCVNINNKDCQCYGVKNYEESASYSNFLSLYVKVVF